MIPSQLQQPEFRFCLLKTKSKIPYESAWQQKGYAHDDKKLLAHISSGGNYGCIGGYGKLRIIDIDTKHPDHETTAARLREAFQTFEVRTGSGGSHFYIFSDYETNHVFIGGAGEYRAHAYQVVGPGCTHPNGRKYEVTADVPIREVSPDTLLELLRPLLRPEPTAATPQKASTEADHSRSGREFSEVCRLIRQGKNREEVFQAMAAFSKWTAAPPQYRELTYSKARANVEATVQEMQTGRADAVFLLADGKRRDATEAIVSALEQKHHFYTIDAPEGAEIYVYDETEGITIENGSTLITESVRQDIRKLFTTQLANEVKAKIASDTFVNPSEFLNSEPTDKIALQNCILNLRTFEQEPFSPNQIFFSKLPAIYNPDAKCPKINSFIDSVFDTIEERQTFYEFGGAALEKIDERHKHLILLGPGSNGKGTINRLLEAFFGHTAVSKVTPQDLERDQYAAGNLLHKHLNTAPDVPDSTLYNTGTLRNVTGGDSISANRKFKSHVDFRPYAKWVLGMNQIPWTRDITDGFFRRWIILHCKKKFVPAKDYDATNKLHLKITPGAEQEMQTPEELSGLLNEAIAGLKRLRQQGSFSKQPGVAEVREEWLRKASSFYAFSRDQLTADPNGEVPKDELRKAYASFCARQGLKGESDKRIRQILQRDYAADEAQRTRSGSGGEDSERVRVWAGIRFREGKQHQLGVAA